MLGQRIELHLIIMMLPEGLGGEEAESHFVIFGLCSDSFLMEMSQAQCQLRAQSRHRRPKHIWSTLFGYCALYTAHINQLGSGAAAVAVASTNDCVERGK